MDNILFDLMPKILAQALKTVREQCALTRTVNRDYDAAAAQKGQIIHVPVPTKMQAKDVQPGATSGTTDPLQLDTAPIPLNYWKEAAFQLSEKQQAEIMDGAPSMQIQEAARALVNAVNDSLAGLYTKSYNFTGVPGTTPFGSSIAEATQVRKLLNKAAAFNSDRHLVLDVDAQASAELQPTFHQLQISGDPNVLREGELGRKLGFDWHYDQQMPFHTAGTASGSIVTDGAPTTTVLEDASDPVLHNPRTLHQVNVTGESGTGTFKTGDLFTVAGDTQQYRIVADTTAVAGAATLTFEPAPAVEWADDSALTLVGSHAVNLGYHRDAIGLAVRSLEIDPMASELKAAQYMTMVDPETRIPLRLEIRQEYKRVRYALDILWGVGMVRPEHVVRLLG